MLSPGSSADADRARIIAFGLRNPFRFTTRPGTDELWIGDVGWDTWEEIARVTSASDNVAENFGWPCYEGGDSVNGNYGSSYQGAGLTLCSTLAGGDVRAPYRAYRHSYAVVSGDGCPTGGSSISGIAFYGAGTYPSSYAGALFFADHTRGCMWAMLPGSDGNPDPTKIIAFNPAAHPVDVKTGPDGDVFYVDMEGGAIHRITYAARWRA